MNHGIGTCLANISLITLPSTETKSPGTGPPRTGEGMTEQVLERPARETAGDDWTPPGPFDVVEVPLLLSGRQMLALEEAAHHRGMTAGEMVRQLLLDFIT